MRVAQRGTELLHAPRGIGTAHVGQWVGRLSSCWCTSQLAGRCKRSRYLNIRSLIRACSTAAGGEKQGTRQATLAVVVATMGRRRGLLPVPVWWDSGRP